MVNCISKAKLLLIIHSTEELPNFDWKQPCILKMNLWVEISLNWWIVIKMEKEGILQNDADIASLSASRFYPFIARGSLKVCF